MMIQLHCFVIADDILSACNAEDLYSQGYCIGALNVIHQVIVEDFSAAIAKNDLCLESVTNQTLLNANQEAQKLLDQTSESINLIALTLLSYQKVFPCNKAAQARIKAKAKDKIQTPLLQQCQALAIKSQKPLDTVCQCFFQTPAIQNNMTNPLYRMDIEELLSQPAEELKATIVDTKENGAMGFNPWFISSSIMMDFAACF